MAIAQKHFNPAKLTKDFFSAVRSLLPTKNSNRGHEGDREQSDMVMKQESEGQESSVRRPAGTSKQKPKRKTPQVQAKKRKEELPPEVSESEESQDTVNPLKNEDPAHRPGHRKLNLRQEFREASGKKVRSQDSAKNRFAANDRISRDTSQIRIDGQVSSNNRRQKSERKSEKSR